MKNKTLGVIACVLVSGAVLSNMALADTASAVVDQKAQFTQEARQKVKAFGMQLKGTLKHEMKANGPVSAVKVCNTQAPAIAKAVSDDGWQVSRTALKVRNSENQPEPWEKTVLERFETQISEGADPKTLEYSAEVDGEFRYMKAIPTGGVCLACHGSEINPELKQHIQAFYPHDQATGFSVGDLRGAFSLSKPLK